jgi:hypothetical protein
MGWGYGRNAEGREIGYSVSAKCDHRGCSKRIDRGLGYVCGGMHDGGERGCGRYFCGTHRDFELCRSCRKRADKDELKPSNPGRKQGSKKAAPREALTVQVGQSAEDKENA